MYIEEMRQIYFGNINNIFAIPTIFLQYQQYFDNTNSLQIWQEPGGGEEEDAAAPLSMLFCRSSLKICKNKFGLKF